ncbi:MAG TPA: M23 family metallopeptidase [Anaerolineales bacterium]|nr:M23 family metallopeptidase [Anaerolineales bacterium]
MKQICGLLLLLFVLLFVVSCTPTEATELPTVVPTKVELTNTSVSPTAIPIVTATLQPPCDPFSTDFCITDGHFILQRPIHPPANDLVDTSYRYGSTANGMRDPHHGVEFGNPTGTPVYAAADGVVMFAGSDQEVIYSPWTDFYGNVVVIKHEEDLFTLYAHLSKTGVQSGQPVSAGDKIGEVGMTGVAIGSHLHFEVRQGNGQDYYATQNPELWLILAKNIHGSPSGALMISVVDQNHELVNSAEYTIRYHPDQPGQPVETYYGSTYPADMLNGEENIALSDLPAGKYRIAIESNGKVYERWAKVESGKLTQVVIIVR